MQPPTNAPEEDEHPPLLGSWRAVYFVVAAELLALVALFYLLGRWAS